MIFKGFGANAKVNERSILRRVRAERTESTAGVNRAKKNNLSFDDGPDHISTPLVLEVLAKRNAKATFFVIAEKAQAERDLLKRTIDDGHAIGNHSLNHSYRLLFSGRREIESWIQKSNQLLNESGVSELVGFRPPAGVCTPSLFTVLQKMSEPLILWSHRFFDTTFAFSEKRVREALPQLRDGDILLLHDRQRASNVKEFCETLDLFIVEATRLGFQCDRLTRELCQKQQLAQQPSLQGKNE